jgi:hypothetical protein
MDQKIFNNILLLLIILVLIKYVSPEPDSVLFVIKKYVNFLIYRIKRVFGRIFNMNTEDFINTEFNGNTFGGIDKFQLKAPNFPSPYQNYWVEYITKKNPAILPNTAKKLYHFIENLVTTDTDDYFISASNVTQNEFTNDQLTKIQNVILQKLNANSFEFTNFEFIKKPVYYNNVGGKEVEPFNFSVDCSENIGKLVIFIELSIRNDIVQNFEYVTIKKIRIVLNNTEINKVKHVQESVKEQQNIQNIPEILPPVNKITPKLNDDNNLYEASFDKKDDYKIDYTNYNDETFNLTSEYENKYSLEEPIVRLMKPISSDIEPEANLVETNNEAFSY